MTSTIQRAALAALLLGASPVAVQAQVVGPAPVPAPPDFPGTGQADATSSGSDILEYKALPELLGARLGHREVRDTGKLPPVAERLPKEPLVYKTGNMPDGPGVYGDVMRHVIGGRPEGWNYLAGQTQGWGGIDIGTLRVPDAHRTAVHGRAGGPGAAAEPREELGLVGGRQGADAST